MRKMPGMAWLVCALAAVSLCHAQEPNLKYFGFYKNISVNPNELRAEETIGFANLAWIAGGPSEPPAKYVAKIAHVGCLGLYAVVDVSDVFFTLHGSPASWKLRDDWETAWHDFANTIAPVMPNVVALYVFDEPHQAGINDVYAPTGLTNLETAIAAIKSRFPGKPVAILYADSAAPTPAAAQALPGITTADWVGIDCYTMYPIHCNSTPFHTALNNLKSALTASQRIILVPQTSLPTTATCSPEDCEAQLVDVMTEMETLAGNEPKVIAMAPFLYWNFYPQGTVGWTGYETLSQTLPTFRNKVMAVGSSISSAMAPTSCKKNRAVINAATSVLLN